MKKQHLLLALALTASFAASAQTKFGNNRNTINSNALVEMESTNKGLLLPRLTQVQRDAMTNVPEGMIVYNTTSKCVNQYNGGQWMSFCEVEGPWWDQTTQKPTNSHTANITHLGNVGIGTITPALPLDVKGQGRVYDDSGLFRIKSVNARKNTNVQNAYLRFEDGVDASLGFIGFGTDVQTLGVINNNIGLGSIIDFGTSGVARMRLDSYGSLSIGGLGAGLVLGERLNVSGAIKISTKESYRTATIIPNATSPVPDGGAGTIVFQDNHFFGWNGSQWKQLDN